MSVPDLSPEIAVDRDVTVIGLGPGCGSIDEGLLDGGLREVLLDAASRASPPRVVLDLSRATFFGSSFIELLFRIRNRLQRKPQGAFAICGVAPYCQEVLKVAHLDRLWRLFPNRDEAVRALADGAT